MLFCVVLPHTAAEAMELTVGRGNIVAVIKKHNPLGDTRMWFVDDGSKPRRTTFLVYAVKSTSITNSNCLVPKNFGIISYSKIKFLTY